MWFWSVSWSTNCSVYFSLFLVDQKKICSVSGNFWSGSDFFGRPNFFLVYQNFFLVYQKIRAWPKKIPRLTKNSLRLNKFFFGRPKKVRNRLDNWSTKRLTKTTWTGLLCKTSQLYIIHIVYICKCEGHLYCTVLAMLSSHPFLSTTSIATNTYSVKLLHRGTFWQELVCWIERIITKNIRNSYIGIEGKKESKEKCPRHKPLHTL